MKPLTGRPRSDAQYDVALSFAGEQRAYVKAVASRLSELEITVFYDAYEAVAMWGKNLYDHLDDVYRNQARFVVIFASREYAEKQWTNHERQSAQARALTENREYVLPARFDDTEIPGILPTIGYVDLRKESPVALAEMIAVKVNADRNRTESPSSPSVGTWEEPRVDPAAGRLTGAIGMAPNLETPIFVMAVTPSLAWPSASWDDSTVDAIERTVGRWFSDLREAAVSETIVDFQVENARGDLLRRVWVDRHATVYRRFAWMTAQEERVDALRVAGEIRRTWLMARDVIPLVLPGYQGPLRYRMAIGSAKGGFRSHASMIHKLEHLSAKPVFRSIEWLTDSEMPFDSSPEQLLQSQLPRMLLAFGYRHASDAVTELVASAALSASAEDPPW